MEWYWNLLLPGESVGATLATFLVCFWTMGRLRHQISLRGGPRCCPYPPTASQGRCEAQSLPTGSCQKKSMPHSFKKIHVYMKTVMLRLTRTSILEMYRPYGRTRIVRALYATRKPHRSGVLMDVGGKMHQQSTQLVLGVENDHSDTLRERSLCHITITVYKKLILG